MDQNQCKMVYNSFDPNLALSSQLLTEKHEEIVCQTLNLPLLHKEQTDGFMETACESDAAEPV